MGLQPKATAFFKRTMIQIWLRLFCHVDWDAFDLNWPTPRRTVAWWMDDCFVPWIPWGMQKGPHSLLWCFIELIVVLNSSCLKMSWHVGFILNFIGKVFFAGFVIMKYINKTHLTWTVKKSQSTSGSASSYQIHINDLIILTVFFIIKMHYCLHPPPFVHLV